jgi:hypothetical protein
MARVEGDEALPVSALAGAAGSLSTAFKNLVAIERQAFNLDAAAPPEGSEISTVQFVVMG